jgi:hypothetical protein
VKNYRFLLPPLPKRFYQAVSGVFLTALFVLAGCFHQDETEDWNWDAGDGKVYARILLPSEEDRIAADFSYTFPKEYARYWEAIFQKEGTQEYFAGTAVSGQSYLVVAVTPGRYNVLILAGADALEPSVGEKVLLASGYAPGETVAAGTRTVIRVAMKMHTVRVQCYDGYDGSSAAQVFVAEERANEPWVFLPGVTAPPANLGPSVLYNAGVMYNAEIARIDALAAAAGTFSALAGQFFDPQLFVQQNSGSVSSPLPFSAPQIIADNAAVQFQSWLSKADVPPDGEYTLWFNMKYRAFGDAASKSSEWNIRRGITYAANSPLGGAVRAVFLNPLANGGTTQFVRNDPQNNPPSYDEVHIFTENGVLDFKPGVSIPATAEILVVAGGGGGGGGNAITNSDGTSSNRGRRGAGGGAGGVVYYDSYSLSQGMQAVIGAGGKGGVITVNGGTQSITSANNGADSSFGPIIAKGGGKGSTHNYDHGGDGGSGGGGSNSGRDYGGGKTGGPRRTSNEDTVRNSNDAANSYGNRGGYGTGIGYAAGGGGGSGGYPESISGGLPGTIGGIGMELAITGVSRWYAAGGNAGSVTGQRVSSSGTVCPSAKGATSIDLAEAGAPNTGNGGGGGWTTDASRFQENGGDGGSGVVVARFPYPLP